MQDSDKNIISFNNESQPLLEKYQNNVISLQESIKKLETKKFEISKNLSNKKQAQNDLQKLSGWLNSKIINFQFEKNSKNLQKQNKNLAHFKDEITFISSQRQKGLELYKDKWVSIQEIQLKKEAEIGLSDNFKSMSDRRFEFFISGLFEEMGYETIVTPQQKDRGVDVIVKKDGEIVAIQCKKYNEKSRVSNKEIAQLIGSAHYFSATRSIFITTSYYTKNAQEQTKNARIKLWDKVDLHEYVKTYLLNKDISKFLQHVGDLEKKDRITRQNIKKEKDRIVQEKNIQKKAKNVCPYCGGGMQNGRTMCSECKIRRRRERRRRPPSDDGYGPGPSQWEWK